VHATHELGHGIELLWAPGEPRIEHVFGPRGPSIDPDQLDRVVDRRRVDDLVLVDLRLAELPLDPGVVGFAHLDHTLYRPIRLVPVNFGMADAAEENVVLQRRALDGAHLRIGPRAAIALGDDVRPFAQVVDLAGCF
jgi:hypothetical protein